MLKNLGLKEQKDATLVSAVIAEANAAHIQFVPTIIIGEHIFDESVTEEELRGYIENKNGNSDCRCFHFFLIKGATIFHYFID